MKKVLLMAVLFCFAVAPAVMAQRVVRSSQSVEPSHQVPTYMVDMTYRASNARQGQPHFAVAGNTGGFSNAKTTSKRAFIMVNREEVLMNSPRLRCKWAKDLLNVAEKKRDEAWKSLDKLMKKQNRERDKLKVRHAKAAMKGVTEELRQEQEIETLRLEEKLAQKLMVAQGALKIACDDYAQAYDLAEAAKRDMKSIK
ncbi:MAG: hypothetical protein IKZ92_08550 [Muribaculaceae bacterium]|nr:hypothetical protein [Muribaculaceae bacterium]